MATHKLDGDWRYFEVGKTSIPQDGVMILKIPDDSTGKIDKGSKHKKDDDLSGKAGSKDIKIREQDSTAGIDLSYEGTLVETKRHMVLIGTWKKNDRNRLTQEDGTWIATKP